MQRQYDKEKRRTRITIYDSDLQSWGLQNVSEESLKTWIKLGLEKEKTLERLKSIEEKINRFIKMMGYFSHHTYLQSALAPIQESFSDEEFQKIWHEKNMLSWKVRDTFFPEFKIRSKESDLEEWLSEHFGSADTKEH